MDDFIIIGSDKIGIRKLKDLFQMQFQTRHLGALKYFLGIEVMRSKKGVFLTQGKYYILDMLKETSLLGAKLAEAPVIPNIKLLSHDGDVMSELEQYLKLVGKLKLNYLIVTCP